MISARNHNAVAVPVETDQGPQWAQFGVTEKGNKYVSVSFEILDGEDAGQKISWFGYFSTEKNAKRTIESLRYCGFKGSDLSTVGDQALEQRVSLTVEHDEYDGKVRAKVAWVNGSGGGGYKIEKPMAAEERRKFAASLTNIVKSTGEVSAEKGERGKAQPKGADERGDDPLTDARGNPPSGIDDDIPF